MTQRPDSSLVRAGEALCNLVGRLDDADWELPTPCADWRVRNLIGHLAATSAMTAALLEGAQRQQAISLLGTDHLGTDPLAGLTRQLAEQAQAFDALGNDQVNCHHPAGAMSSVQLLDLRIADLVIHTWDLAVAVGADPTLDPTLVDEAWRGLSPMAPFIGRLGVFGDGPTGVVDGEAPLQARLLDLTGRRVMSLA